ncbi:MAG: PcfJ domain-containing protein [Lachnospiraceae bacterium]|nr:PcfJ domain-containing protein [Lachnospiraceae bacterium]
MTIEEAEKLKPIPKYIRQRIERQDKSDYGLANGHVRFYAYLFLWKWKEPIKITVAVKHYRKKLYMKQVAIHALHGKQCFVKDMEYSSYLTMGYKVGWFDQGIAKHETWYEGHGWGWADDKYYDPYAPIVNLEALDRLPQFRYSAHKLYDGSKLFKYLRIYEQFPQAEMLVKFGLSEFATSKQILRKIEKDKSFRKWLINRRAELIHRGYYVGTVLYSYKCGKPLTSAQRFLESKKTFYRSGNYREIKELFSTPKELSAFFDYTEKQDISFASYTDYLNACIYLGLNMSLKKNKFPHDFKRWHDIRIDQYHTAKALKDAEERKELYEKFATVAEKYLPLQQNKNGAFIVVIAHSPQDLIREGDMLHHCVGRMNYDQKFAREESLIFFVRNIAEPDTPFVTLEYSLKSKKILQCYGERDSKPDEQVLEFVNKKWLPYANRKLKQIAA